MYDKLDHTIYLLILNAILTSILFSFLLFFLTEMQDEQKYIVLAIVWNHWTKEEIQCKKDLWKQKCRMQIEIDILQKLHVVNFQTFIELWNLGIDFIGEQFILDLIIERASLLQEARIAYGVCGYCHSQVCRIQVHLDGIFITCSSESCQQYGDDFEPLILF